MPAAWGGAGLAVSAFGGAATPARWCSGGQVNGTTFDDADLMWAMLTGTSQAVAGSGAPIVDDTTRIALRLGIADAQPAGSYSGTIAVTAFAQP